MDEDLIKEPLTDADEKFAKKSIERVSHISNEEIMKQMAEKLARTKLKSDDEIWEEIQKKEGKEKSKSKMKTAEKIVEKSAEETKNFTSENPPELERHVHFEPETLESNDSDLSDPESPLEIKFSFSDARSEPKFSEKGSYETPWDIFENYKNSKAAKKTSILKPTRPLKGNC